MSQEVEVPTLLGSAQRLEKQLEELQRRIGISSPDPAPAEPDWGDPSRMLHDVYEIDAILGRCSSRVDLIHAAVYEISVALSGPQSA